MNSLKTAVETAITEELYRANGKFGPFNSTHEGYAVILEEVEEAKSEMALLEKRLSALWHDVKVNNFSSNKSDCYKHGVKALEADAGRLAAEAIQIAAMARKFMELLYRSPQA